MRVSSRVVESFREAGKAAPRAVAIRVLLPSSFGFGTLSS